MLRFIAAKEAENSNGIQFKPKGDKPLTGAELGALTQMVVNKFLSQVDWDDIVAIYLGGLTDAEDTALIQRAVKALFEGGVEFVGA